MLSGYFYFLKLDRSQLNFYFSLQLFIENMKQNGNANDYKLMTFKRVPKHCQRVLLSASSETKDFSFCACTVKNK